MLSNRLFSPLSFRAICAGDQSFLAQLYASTRAAELAAVPWSDAEKQTFLLAQFQFQHRYYQEHFPVARFDVIEWAGAAIGRVYVNIENNNIRLIDIALLPEYQQRGIGTFILRDLMQQASQLGGYLRLYVELNNPAYLWYERLGFVAIGTNGVYQQMEWSSVTAEKLA